MSNTTRIAKNTLALYFRQILIMLVSLYTSRVTLSALGIVDYGIYNAIGGFVAMFSIISGAMSVAISRFITVEIGNGNKEKLRRIFSTSVMIQLFMSLTVIVLAEGAGLWFMNTKMVIPGERLAAANVVFQCSLLTFVLNLLSVPYNADIIAHERMTAFAYISVAEVLLKLGAVFFLRILPFDKLGVYAVLIAAVAAVIRLVYGIYCKRNFEESKFSFVFDKRLVREMLLFIGWAFFGNGVVVLKDQGINVLINIFCGPAVNAARGVAMQVNSAVYSFVQNFMTAVSPQITKSYAAGSLESMYSLIIRSSKFGFFIMMVMVVPLCANIDYVLSIWLVEVPEHTANFVVLVLLYSLAGCFMQSVLTGVLAEGKIRNYEIALTAIYLVNFICAYFLLKTGFAVELIFAANIVFELAVLAALLVQSRQRYGFPAGRFLLHCVVPSCAAFLPPAMFAWFSPFKSADTFPAFAADTAVLVLASSVSALFLGMRKNERAYVKNMILEKARRVIKK